MRQTQNSAAICRDDNCQKPAKVRGYCRTHYHALWRRENYERNLEKGRRYQQQNAERISERNRENYQKNREAILARQKERNRQDPEYRQRKRDFARKWRIENPERYRENHRRYFAKRKYGLTLEEYDAIIARGCAICGTHDGRVVGQRGEVGKRNPLEPRLCIDHDHANGKVRDALCHSCNSGVGLFSDDPARLRAAADYIERHQLSNPSTRNADF